MGKRINFTSNQKQLLIADVGKVCPLCKEPLFYRKEGQIQLKYEIAHIYPLNPTEEEEKILKGVEILGKDRNDLDNLIILCRDCHKMFDNPRTKSEYNKILEIKKQHIKNSKNEDKYKKIHIEESLKIVLDSLTKGDKEKIELDYNPKTIENKLKGRVNPIILRRLKSNVSEYFGIIKEYLGELDEKDSLTSDLIASQVKTMYLSLKINKNNEEEIFKELVNWINTKNDFLYIDASEIIISYFIQSCEVFDEITK